MPTYEVYTDGACSGNPGPGGWAAVIRTNVPGLTVITDVASGGAPATTNNAMELMAAIEGLRQTPQSAKVTLFSDSQYVIKGMTLWVASWKKKGWKTGDGKPVANRELWETLVATAAHREVTWQWVKGHASNEFNNMADKWAVKERDRHAKEAG